VLDLPQAITAVGGLGTAAFGLVDATKPVTGINRVGFSGIQKAVGQLIPGRDAANALSHSKIFATLEANWINGTDLGSQKAIAKSLIKLNLNQDNAESVAKATGIDPDVLPIIASKIASGEKLTEAASDAFGRFDLMVTAILDEAYQRSDQTYRNGTRMLAMAFSVVLVVAGALSLQGLKADWGVAVIVGLLATPLAPIAKDLSTALATAVNALQAVKK
jgi:hypothetical protein